MSGLPKRSKILMQNKIWKPWKSKFTPDLAYAPSKPINPYFLFQGCQILNTRVAISQVNLKCYKNQILEEFCLTYFSFFWTVYCWSTYYTTYYQELFQLCNKWATCTWFTVVLGLECSSRHILDMFLLFQRPSAARCCRKTLAMVCAAAIATVLLKKILWDRRRYIIEK